jgi:hypothetical protein
VGCVAVLSVVLARHERERGGGRHARHIVQHQGLAQRLRQGLPQRANCWPDCWWMHSSGSSAGQPCARSVCSSASAKAQKAGYCRSPKPSTVTGTALALSFGDALQRVAGVGRGLAFAIGGGQHKHLPRGGRGLEVLQRAGVHAVAALGQRVLQRLGKTPGAAAFAGDEDEHVGLCQRAVARDVGAWRRACHQMTTPDSQNSSTLAPTSPSTTAQGQAASPVCSTTAQS